MNWTKSKDPFTRRDNEFRYELNANVPYARGERDGGLKIEAAVHYNGSGPQAFGGAKKWPAVQMRLSFPEGAYAERDKFVAELQKFLEGHFKT